MKRTESGITLIALVVTIVVLLILAGVSLSLVLENNGIINKAKDAEVVTRAGSVEDEVTLWKADQYLAGETNDTAETEEEMLARLTSNKLITADDEIDTTNKIIKIKKTDGTIVKEISYAYTTNKVTENIFEYTAEGYITGIKDEYITETNPDTANVKELVKMANINENNSIKIAATLAPEYYLIKELNGEITIPKEIEGTKIIGINNDAFLGIVNLKKVTINAEIKEIGTSAFAWCKSLSIINIPQSTTVIGERAFYVCESLSTINIPNSVTTIGEEAFGSCSSLTEITIPNSITTIGALAFISCSSLNMINIPDSVTTIGSYAFANCSNLTTINIPESVTEIGDEAFSGCTSLTEITIPNKDITVRINICAEEADITFNVPYKEGEQPETWDANWNGNGIGDNTITVNYAK